MRIEIQPAGFAEVESMREQYRHEANCRIVHDSALPRGIADPWLMSVDGHTAGYAGVWNTYYEGRVMEFFTTPDYRASAVPLFRELLAASRAGEIEAQTDMPLMSRMLDRFATDVVVEEILFDDGADTDLQCADAIFRRAHEDDDGPDGEWVLEVADRVVAAGGVLYHYNPPWGDIYMAVSEQARGRGYGSFIVQELKRVCYEAGRRPAARCNPSNTASRRTLEKAGFRECARLMAGVAGTDP